VRRPYRHLRRQRRERYLHDGGGKTFKKKVETCNHENLTQDGLLPCYARHHHGHPHEEMPRYRVRRENMEPCAEDDRGIEVPRVATAAGVGEDGQRVVADGLTHSASRRWLRQVRRLDCTRPCDFLHSLSLQCCEPRTTHT
jgi:hypothetical protein